VLDMRHKTANVHLFETIVYTLLATAAVGIIFYLFHFAPVTYTILISEDKWGEYGTFVSYGIAGALLLALSFRRGPYLRRVMWVIIGLAAIFLAGEEISWGQRILKLSTPEFLLQYNFQGEINLHNMEAFKAIKLGRIAGYVVLVWSIISMMVSILMPRLEEKIMAIGVPLIPIRLIPIFVLVPFFFLIHPAPKSSEIAELFLGIAVVMWAVDLFLGYGWIKPPAGLTVVCLMVGMLFLVAIMSATLTYMYPKSLTWRLNLMATRDYPKRGMYDQAQRLYDYIYAHPHHIRSYTRLNHGRMLLELGKQLEAFDVLSKAVKVLEAKNPPEAGLSKHMRQLGIIFTLLGQNDRADVEFNHAIEIDRQQLALVSRPNKKSKLLWSISETMEARGDVASAIENVRQARAIAVSAKLSFKLEKWIKTLEKK